MDKVKVKIFPDNQTKSISFDRGDMEEEINEFIVNNDIEVIDVRLTSNQYGFLFALLLYKEKN
jgi:hypothetical protein